MISRAKFCDVLEQLADARSVRDREVNLLGLAYVLTGRCVTT